MLEWYQGEGGGGTAEERGEGVGYVGPGASYRVLEVIDWFEG